ncbi:MAG TPA: D-alanine--D-alanine ligase family protein [Acidimicrobiales bacterium]|nr:D-alanine--D-alanine ligase family protein [Acidimicrobiales bacterium]
MAPGERVRLVVLFGGRSAEHEVSCVSALHVLRAIDPERYEVVPIGITRQGRWVAGREVVAALPAAATALPSPDSLPGPAVDPLPALAGERPGDGPVVVFPLLHGPMGEDGTVQGMLELAGVPYVGAGVLGSALCMDKAMAKQVLRASGLPVADWVAARAHQVDDAFEKEVADRLGFPVFVKPANLGSSVGVNRVDDAPALRAALDEALRYDEMVVVEEAVGGREIEVAVLGNEQPRASVPGEIRPSHGFYDYEEKYISDGALLLVPAELDEAAATEVRGLAVEAYRSLRVDGMARADFFYEEDGRGFLVNELNTIPGFTPISMYPKLWEASGLPYDELIGELVRLALERHDRRARFDTVR